MSTEDDDMAKIIQANLSANLSLPYGRLTVAVDLGQVTLVGDLDHPFQIEAAADSVWSTPGVRGLDNRTRVQARCPTPDLSEDVGGSTDMDSLVPDDPAEKRHCDLLAGTLASGMIAARSPTNVEDALAIYYRVRVALDR